MTNELSFQQVVEKNQEARFNNLSNQEKQTFLEKLISSDGFNEVQAKIVYGLFETGQAGSIDEAKELMRESDKGSHYSDI